MHELAVTQALLELALQTAAQHGVQRINAIDLRIGVLSSIVDDSVQFYFDQLARGTAAEGAQLRFVRVAATLLCLDCQQRVEVVPPLPACCPSCNGIHLLVSGGDAFAVESIEVDDETPGRYIDSDYQ